MKPIRVLCVFADLNIGGAESMCMNIYRNINTQKVQFDFVKHYENKGAFEDEILYRGGKVYNAPQFRLTSFIEYAQWWNCFFEKHPEYKIIHGHYFTLNTVIFPIAKLHHVITIGHCHSAITPNSLKARLEISFIRLSEKFTDYCFACSQNAGKMMYPHRTVTILNNAIDTELFIENEQRRMAVREAFGIHKDSFVVGTVGRIVNVKNPFGIIEIFNYIQRINKNSVLLWVGDGELKEQVIERLDKLGLRGKVILTGVRTDVNNVMQAMDVFILPSFFEGLPVTLVEAQAAGLNCYVSDMVSKEANITGKVSYISIDDYHRWGDIILSSCNDKYNKIDTIKKAGYDIKTTAKYIEIFYISVYSKRGDAKWKE